MIPPSLGACTLPRVAPHNSTSVSVLVFGLARFLPIEKLPSCCIRTRNQGWGGNFASKDTPARARTINYSEYSTYIGTDLYGVYENDFDEKHASMSMVCNGRSHQHAKNIYNHSLLNWILKCPGDAPGDPSFIHMYSRTSQIAIPTSIILTNSLCATQLEHAQAHMRLGAAVACMHGASTRPRDEDHDARLAAGLAATHAPADAHTRALASAVPAPTAARADSCLDSCARRPPMAAAATHARVETDQRGR
jgi:hypothetical protein